MKFDIVRAWKDESYRQALSDEQREMLPANPAGELTDAEMECVCGGGGGGGMPVMPAAPVAPVAPVVHHVYHHVTHVGVVTTAASAVSSTHIHSFGLLCDVSLFSLNAVQVPVIPIASPFSQCCSECD